MGNTWHAAWLCLMDLSYVILSHTRLHLFVYNGVLFLILTEVNGSSQIRQKNTHCLLKLRWREGRLLKNHCLSSELRVRLVWYIGTNVSAEHTASNFYSETVGSIFL